MLNCFLSLSFGDIVELKTMTSIIRNFQFQIRAGELNQPFPGHTRIFTQLFRESSEHSRFLQSATNPPWLWQIVKLYARFRQSLRASSIFGIYIPKGKRPEPTSNLRREQRFYGLGC